MQLTRNVHYRVYRLRFPERQCWTHTSFVVPGNLATCQTLLNEPDPGRQVQNTHAGDKKQVQLQFSNCPGAFPGFLVLVGKVPEERGHTGFPTQTPERDILQAGGGANELHQQVGRGHPCRVLTLLWTWSLDLKLQSSLSGKCWHSCLSISNAPSVSSSRSISVSSDGRCMERLSFQKSLLTV